MKIEFEHETASGIELKELLINSLPQNITLRQYVDIGILCSKQNTDLLAKPSNSLTNNELNSIIEFCIEFISILSDTSIDELQELKINSDDFSLLKIVNHIYNEINSYQPSERKEFYHNGRRFVVPHTNISVLGKKMGANMSVIQNITAFELERIYGITDNDGRVIDQDYKFKSIIGIMACLCTEVLDNELIHLPIRDDDRELFLSKKIALFSTITMDIALDVDFFLRNTNDTLKNITSLNTHSAYLHQAIANS